MLGAAAAPSGPSPAVPDHIRFGFVVVSVSWPKLLVSLFVSLVVAIILAAVPDQLAEGLSTMPPPGAPPIAAATAPPAQAVSARIVTQRAATQLRKTKPGAVMEKFCETKQTIYFLDKVCDACCPLQA